MIDHSAKVNDPSAITPIPIRKVLLSHNTPIFTDAEGIVLDGINQLSIWPRCVIGDHNDRSLGVTPIEDPAGVTLGTTIPLYPHGETQISYANF